MGNSGSLTMIQLCLGAEIASPVIKSLAGTTQGVIEGVTARNKGMGASPGLDTVQVAQLLGEGRGNHAHLAVLLLEIKGIGRVDFYEMLAIMIMFGKIPARLKVRNLFDLFDLDFDGNLNSSETVLMLRSTLSAIAKSTGGVVPTTGGVEAIWQHMLHAGYADEGRLSYSQWVIFCSKTREVHALGKALDFNKGTCRRALILGGRVLLPVTDLGQEDPEVTAQRAAAAKKMQERATLAREQKRAAAAREGKSRFARSSVLRIKEVFDTIDKDGSGYVDEREWRRLTQDTPLAASDETLLFVEREREGRISIVEVLCEVYPFAGDADLTKMLQWISEEPMQGMGRLVNRELAVAERGELAALFQIYDTEGNGEMTLGELSDAMAGTVGLTKADVMPMFSQAVRSEEDYINASEFADTLMEFVDGDSSIQSLVRAL